MFAEAGQRRFRKFTDGAIVTMRKARSSHSKEEARSIVNVMITEAIAALRIAESTYYKFYGWAIGICKWRYLREGKDKIPSFNNHQCLKEMQFSDEAWCHSLPSAVEVVRSAVRSMAVMAGEILNELSVLVESHGTRVWAGTPWHTQMQKSMPTIRRCMPGRNFVGFEHYTNQKGHWKTCCAVKIQGTNNYDIGLSKHVLDMFEETLWAIGNVQAHNPKVFGNTVPKPLAYPLKLKTFEESMKEWASNYRKLNPIKPAAPSPPPRISPPRFSLPKNWKINIPRQR